MVDIYLIVSIPHFSIICIKDPIWYNFRYFWFSMFYNLVFILAFQLFFFSSKSYVDATVVMHSKSKAW